MFKLKHFWILFLVVLSAIMLTGCPGTVNNNRYTVSVISLGGGGTSLTNKTVTPTGGSACPDGADGKFNASTGTLILGQDYHRVLYLQAQIKDEGGSIINISDTQNIIWSSDFDPSDILPQSIGEMYDICSNVIGVHSVTASYQGYTSVNKILLYKRIFFPDNTTSTITLNGYLVNGANPDLTLTCHSNTYSITAPGGIAVVEIKPSTWLDPVIRQDLGSIAAVPAGLSFSESLDIPMDISYICIVKESGGTGYAKILFSQGINYNPAGMDVYLEYSSTDQFQLYY